MGVTVFSLGVGREYDVNQLNAMATDPDHDHVFTSDFSHLHSSLVEKIKDKACTSKFDSILEWDMAHVATACNRDKFTTCTRLSKCSRNPLQRHDSLDHDGTCHGNM